MRGLLCLTCNVALGYIEVYSELAMTYLGTALRPASPQPQVELGEQVETLHVGKDRVMPGLTSWSVNMIRLVQG